MKRTFGQDRRAVGGRKRVHARLHKLAGLAALTAFTLLSGANAHGAPTDQAREPRFRYTAGTEDVRSDCRGTLDLTEDALVFRCAPYAVSVPYDSIEIMQYRSDVSRRVRKMKLRWRIWPPSDSGGRNRYFVVVYKAGGAQHAIVLRVPSDEMRPYLAEIDLKAGRRVDVQRHQDYE